MDINSFNTKLKIDTDILLQNRKSKIFIKNKNINFEVKSIKDLNLPIRKK